jgi:hypothetical protein
MLLGTISIFGAISAACCYAVYGVNLFQPYEMIVRVFRPPPRRVNVGNLIQDEDADRTNGTFRLAGGQRLSWRRSLGRWLT